MTTACGVPMAALGRDISAPLVGPAHVSAYSVGWRTDRWSARIYPSVAGVVLLVAGIMFDTGPLFAEGRISLVMGVLLAGAFAEVTRSRQNYLAAVQARAELAERTREEEARHRVAEERLRIARELHDVVAHHMALSHAQASTAAYLLHTKPEQVQELLNQLADTTSSALRELKAAIGLLRRDEDIATPLEPTPGLSQLPELLASFESMGLQVSMSISGEPKPLSPGVDLTAYRIVQEALTNVTKHAGTGSASVQLVYSPSVLRVTISDDGHGLKHAGDSGYGLIGMSERAISVGGELLARDRPGGGFEVSTILPLEPRSRDV